LSAILKERDRKVIPRWRDSQVTLITGELGSVGAPPELQPRDDAFFDTKKREWKNKQSVPLATDLVGSAFVLGREPEAVEAARFIISNGKNASLIAKDLAMKVLHPGMSKHSPGIHIDRPDNNNIRRKVHDLRVRSTKEPRNALLWVDLALQYTLLDEREKAKKAMRLGLYLAPRNRLVLRAAARLYVHLGNYDFANYIVRNAETVGRDPWVVATEIVTATIAGRNSRLIKTGLKLLDDFSRAPMHVSELASALATLEFSHGNHKGSRKLFRRALDSPNENSLAQARWAAEKLGLDIEDSHKVPLAFEADAMQSYQQWDMKKAFHQAKAWLYDQPFSIQPADFACFLSSVALEEYQETVSLAELSERSNPGNLDLSYHKIFALGSLNLVDEAQVELEKAKKGSSDTRHQILALANQGLIHYRRGAPDLGRGFYRQALLKAEGKAFERMRAMAAIYYAREELLARAPNSNLVLELAHQEADGISGGGVEVALERLCELVKELGKSVKTPPSAVSAR
jgi:tetratricopeptide (TPR) repeat protein